MRLLLVTVALGIALLFIGNAGEGMSLGANAEHIGKTLLLVGVAFVVVVATMRFLRPSL
jgi:hypothetical protein